MFKRLISVILLAHLLVPLSLLLPVLQIPENASSLIEASHYYNIFDYVILNKYVYVTALLISFIVAELLGVANAIYGLAQKEIKHFHVRASFVLGFSSAILGAMFISAGSYTFFAVCAISFLLISYCSIKLMKLEK